ncbi:hypothetical protein ACFCX4_33545 [Kitasatospora sp. NPDC056327]|uniref:hypothetical protein n=1 Tax=Kitasatospora sp. NPDC056327 TaxID=3345785 RepID=UPI0035DE074C
MTESGAWKTLVTGDAERGVVLAVDFDTTGRPEARFSDLMAKATSDFAVWETVPPAADSESARSAAGYVEHWAAPFANTGNAPRIRAVMGFCAGSVYAAALADRIAEMQGEAPLLLLFDPELSTAQTLMWQFHKVIGFMSATLSQEDIAEAREIGQRAHDSTPEVGELKDELIRLMRRFGEPALVRVGLDEARREELFSVFDSFLSYLAVAADIDPRERWRSAVALNSTSPLSGLNAMRASGVEIEVAEEVVIDVEHGTMLADGELAAVVTRLLDI